MNRCFLLAVLAAVPTLRAQTFVRVRDDIGLPPTYQTTGPSSGPVALLPLPTALCGTVVVAPQGAPIAGAGLLAPSSFANPAVPNRAGAIAFYAQASGTSRNQGIFVADPAGVHPIAMGCGQGGGSGQHGSCGDPSPLGGTFAGFFGGTVFAPSLNDRGDVLFVADLVNASAPRGLFLYQAGTATIVKIAAVGDPSPLGGTFSAIGPGSLNDYGEVVFLAMGAAPLLSDAFVWRNGTLATVAAVGMAAPGGGTFTYIGSESLTFVDGTTVPIGPVPAINDCGQITFRGLVQGGIAGRGLFVQTNGVNTWALQSGAATPVGGTFLDFQGAAISGRGELAFFADYRDVNNTPTSGWFAGAPGALREVLSFNSPVDGGQCLGLAFSRNPMKSIDDQGNVVLWCDISAAGNQGRLILVAPGGSIEVLARQGGPTGTGGTYGTLDAWPSLSGTGHATVDAGVIAGGVTSPYLLAQLCGPILAASPCAPPGGQIRLDNEGAATDAFVTFAALSATNVPLPPFGTLEIGPGGVVPLYGPIFYPGVGAPHVAQLPLPPSPGLVGTTVYCQSLRLTGNQLLLTNSARTTIR